MPHGDVWDAHSWQFGNPNYFISAKAFDLSSPQESVVFSFVRQQLAIQVTLPWVREVLGSFSQQIRLASLSFTARQAGREGLGGGPRSDGQKPKLLGLLLSAPSWLPPSW